MTRLLLDEMYPPALAVKLREQGHDVVAALEVEVDLSARSDEDVLAWAALGVLLAAKRLPPPDGVVWLNSPG